MVSHGVPPDRSPPVDPASGLLSIGIPMFQVGARVVDDAGDPVPAGEPGELLISGPGIADGYWRRPEETAATFGGGWLRTGDIAFMDPEGWFFLLDRKKDMIIASGYKVWPREVEEALYTHPAVREAVVIGVPDAYRGETVAAYVSLKAGLRADEAALIAHCRSALAAFKAPRTITILDELPKTVTGKLLRRALRERAGGQSSDQQHR
jgi:long-chain acyl-CoA synthetase